MMDITIASATEITIIAAVVAAGTQLVKQTKLPNAYLPYVAAAIGILSGLVAAVITKDSNYMASAVQGLITAAGTSWVVDAAKPATAAVSAKVSASKEVKAKATAEALDAAVTKAATKAVADALAKQKEASNDQTQA
jgi:hypothetical protein